MATPLSDFIPLTGDLRQDQLVQGSSWTFAGEQVLTYSFSVNDEPGNQPAWTATQKSVFRQALTAWSNVADLRFVEVESPNLVIESPADLAVTLLRAHPEVAALGIFPDPDFADQLLPTGDYTRVSYPQPEGDIAFNISLRDLARPTVGGAGMYIMLHEIAHALGIKHPFDDGGNERPVVEYPGHGQYGDDDYSVMWGPYHLAGKYPVTPMLLDILVIQHIYGANMSYHTGDDTYALPNSAYRAIWDAGGDDTLSAAAWSGAAQLDLREGELSGLRFGARRIAIAYDVTIENAAGGDGADRIIGNGAANRLDGGAGADVMSGGTGNDRLIGGGHADTLSGEGGNDVLQWRTAEAQVNGGTGYDTLRLASGDLDLTALANNVIIGVERINMAGAGVNTLTLAAQDVLDLSPSSSTLRVVGDAGDTVIAAGFVAVGGPSGGFRTYTSGAATLLVETDVAVIL
jgi:serralysin